MVVRSGRLISGLEANLGDRAVNGGPPTQVDARGRTASFRAPVSPSSGLGGPMRRYLCSLLGLTLAATSLDAQGLRDKISDLFIFAAGQDPPFLGRTAPPAAAPALHPDPFVPSAPSHNRTLILFIGPGISHNRPTKPGSSA